MSDNTITRTIASLALSVLPSQTTRTKLLSVSSQLPVISKARVSTTSGYVLVTLWKTLITEPAPTAMPLRKTARLIKDNNRLTRKPKQTTTKRTALSKTRDTP